MVVDPPEIELSTNKVHSGESKEAHLTCIVKGNPNPTVSISFFLNNFSEFYYFMIFLRA